MRHLCLSLLLSVCFVSLYAQVLTPAPPAAAGFDAKRLERIDNLLQQYIDSGWINGATALVARNGKVVYHKGVGYNDVPSKTSIQKDAIMRIASQTKAITSVAVMMLYEEGKFLLDEPVSKYIPAFKNPIVLDKYNEKDTSYTTVPAKSEITIRQLLTHTSGIHYAQIGSKEFNAIYRKAGIVAGIGTDNLVLGDVIKKLAKLPLAHHPGEKYTYGLNTDVLGYLIEVVSGERLDLFFQSRIFEPLGMKDTYFYLPKSKQNKLATLYTQNEKRLAVKAPQTLDINGTFYTDYPSTDGTYFSGGGGLSSTAYDYAIFMQMLLNDGVYNGKRLLSRNTVRIMHTNQIGNVGFRNGRTFGLGFEIITESGAGGSLVPEGTYSWGGMFSSSYWIDPTEKIVGQLFLQIYPFSHGQIHDKFKVAVYQALNN